MVPHTYNYMIQLVVLPFILILTIYLSTTFLSNDNFSLAVNVLCQKINIIFYNIKYQDSDQ
jgi:hypothetical protein